MTKNNKITYEKERLKLVNDFFDFTKSFSQSNTEDQVKLFMSLLAVREFLNVRQKNKEEYRDILLMQKVILETSQDFYEANSNLKNDIKNGKFKIHEINGKEYIRIKGLHDFKYFLEVIK
ncbi:hypothetical protein V8046_000004 [Vibrio parahaemolyticus]|nr:hypothetical protein [Vibrio parahaemolyticus]EIA1624453.1 hypothetical protein [Vibrio parahaemolyticus]EIV8503184.1 hypothetical protein [Vibrio parahaemolyticus]EIV8635774.1 hypothetical protein [Vibrio parahaemolyticus]EIZ1449345.1 hypothetical protein [Vibrio parahaemolyticus]